ncbi:MAG: prolyl oligopeptidase family serine peptidase, partial [Blastocatellia bacterium]|nr:prolyl oligopeptidase family serine peptidase [Blastocatellia bacterium]
SMGGYGTWAIARDHPGKFAAYAPVCGGVRPPPRLNLDDPRVSNSADPYMDVAKKIGKAQVWVFHGGADPVVPVSESQKMVEALKSSGGNVRYNEYEGVGHNSWDTAYGEAEFFSWLLSQKLDSPAKTARRR